MSSRLRASTARFWSARQRWLGSADTTVKVVVIGGTGESKTVIVDPDATYFGAPRTTNSLVVPA
jgi:hypothetical protein